MVTQNTSCFYKRFRNDASFSLSSFIIFIISEFRLLGHSQRDNCRHLLVNPKDRRVVIVDNVLSTSGFRDLIADVLYNHFEVS